MKYSYEYVKKAKVEESVKKEISHIEWIESSGVLVSADYGGIVKVWDKDVNVCKHFLDLFSGNLFIPFRFFHQRF